MALGNEIFRVQHPEPQVTAQESSRQSLVLQAQNPPQDGWRQSLVLESQVAPQDSSHQSPVLESQTSGTGSSGASERNKDGPDSASLVQNGKLPDLQIDGANTNHENGSSHFPHSAGKVAKDLETGFVNEITHHPLHIIEAAATGLALGVAAVTLLPEAAIGTAVVLAGSALGLDLGFHLMGWAHDASVVTHSNEHTATEVSKAHADLQGVGAGAALLLAGTVGSLATGPAISKWDEFDGLK